MAAPASWEVIRGSIAERAAVALRAAIRNGELTDPLPGEHELARRLGVSRTSVGAALAHLAAEGLIVVRQGCRSRLAVPARARGKSLPPTVCSIWPAVPDDPYARQSSIRTEVRTHFVERGFRWEEAMEPRLFGRNSEEYARRLVAGRRHVCWILFMAPERTQRALAKTGVPAVIVGTCYPGVNLPSVDFDHVAVGWHAAGTIIGHGHTRIGLIIPEQPSPGDQAIQLAFLRYVHQQAPGVTVTELRAPADPYHYRARLDRLLRAPDRPTVLLTMRQSRTLTLIVHLLASGIRIPGDISIVSRDTHPLFEAAMPELTRYSGSEKKLAARIVRVASGLLAGRPASAQPNVIAPAFMPGSTLADLRESALPKRR